MAKEVLIHCPSCGRKKMSWSHAKKVGYCFRCQYVAQVWHVLGAPSPQEDHEVPLLPDVHLEPASHHPSALSYLDGRRVSDPDGIYYDPVNRSVYFPIWSPSPEFQPSWHTRSIEAGKGWRVFPGTAKQHYMWGRYRRAKDRVVLVEGIFDAMRIGNGALSLLGSALYPTHSVFLERFREVLVWGDPDDAGDHLDSEVVRQLGSRVTVVEYDREAGDLLEGNEMLSAVRRWLNGTPDLPGLGTGPGIPPAETSGGKHGDLRRLPL